MNTQRIEKAISKAKRKIALKKLGTLKDRVFYDKETKRWRLVYNIFVKKGEEKTPKQNADIERIEMLCRECDIDSVINIYIDDLGDEFGEETE